MLTAAELEGEQGIWGGAPSPLMLADGISYQRLAMDGLPGTLSGPRGSGLLLDLSREILLVPPLLLFTRFKFVFQVTGTDKKKKKKKNK